MLRKFTYNVSNKLLDDYLEMDVLLDDILDFISSVRQHLINFGEKIYNEAAIAYYLLMAVNLYANNSPECNETAPLNKKYQTNAYIYRYPADSMITANLKSLDLEDQIRTLKIRNDFRHLTILEKEELKEKLNPPRMVTLAIDRNHAGLRRIMSNQCVKIAIVPFGRKDICETAPKEKGGFRISYSKAHLKNGIKKAKKLLELAISDGANIVVFPEYVCFPKMQDAISDYLREIALKYPTQLNELLLVIAGSGWTSDDNNVSQVFSSDGILLGKHYKCEAYHKLIEKKDSLDPWPDYDIEGLENPGKESVIIQIPELGSVMTAICRDISNQNLIETMARVFRVDFLMVPAWSTSLHKAFEDQLKNITSTNRNTCSVVCNGCGAIREKHWAQRRDRGLVVMPCKEGSRITGNSTTISIDEKDFAQCSDCSGCIFSLSLHLRPQDIESGKNPAKERIF